MQALRAQTEPATTFVDAPETLRGTVREIVIDDAMHAIEAWGN